MGFGTEVEGKVEDVGSVDDTRDVVAGAVVEDTMLV